MFSGASGPHIEYGIFRNKRLYDPLEWARVRRLEAPVGDIASAKHDGVTFWAADNTGFALTASITRLAPGNACNQWFCVKAPGNATTEWLQQLEAPDAYTAADGACDAQGWSARGLRLTRLHSAQSWRISFGGVMTTGERAIDRADDEDCDQCENEAATPRRTVTVFARLTFRARTNPYDMLTTGGIADAANSLVDQWGIVSGTLRIDDATHEIHAHAVKLLSRGPAMVDSLAQRSELFAVNRRGNCLRLGQFGASDDGVQAARQVKYAVMPFGDVCELTADVGEILRLTAEERAGAIRVNTKYDEFRFTFQMTSEVGVVLDADWSRVAELRFFTFTCEDGDFVGVHLRHRRQPSRREAPSLLSQYHTPSSHDNIVIGAENYASTWIVTFGSPQATQANIVGGKFSQLVQLEAAKSHFSSHLTIPNAFAVTASAFDKHVAFNESIQNGISGLKTLTTADDIRRECDAVVKLITDTEIDASMKEEILAQCRTTFGEDFDANFLAIRSSAITEDGNEASGAGQMATFLGIRGADSICDHIRQCWASLYTHRAVEYRRAHGLPINTSMAVVIQRNIKADCAGVIFTMNPSTGNYNEMVINSNFGLGETVVSGEVDTDSIVLSKQLHSCSIVGATIGTKDCSAHLTEDGVVTGPSDRTTEPSLGEGEACLLGKLAMEIEEFFGAPRDIEWAIESGDVYILQARPITGLDVETNDELAHEFDSAIDNDRVCLTTGNVQEVMPSAITPLSLSICTKAGDIGMQNTLRIVGLANDNNQTNTVLPCVNNHIFFNLSYLSLTGSLRVAASSIDMIDLSILGRIVTEKNVEDERRYVGRASAKERHITFLRRTRGLFGLKKCLWKWERILKVGYEIPMRATYSEQIREIDSYLESMFVCYTESLNCSIGSSLWSMALAMTLAKDGEWDAKLYSSMALLLSSCGDVISAEVPNALNDLASAIRQVIPAQQFVEQTPDQALAWLHSEESGDAGTAFASFMSRHGHRCLREFELRKAPWREEPVRIVEPLQAILRSGGEGVGPEKAEGTPKPPNLTPLEALDAMRYAGNWLSRRMLAGLVGKARESVRNREWGKSLLVKMVAAFKVAYANCGRLMAAEGRIPDVDLIYFFTHEELLHLATRQAPSLVRKAVRRRGILSTLADAQFAEISFGGATPVESDETEPAVGDLELRGLPIGGGVVTGRCRVVRTLAEARWLTRGEVLVVTRTDVGWTPYFGLAAAVVTEMGGLISHGAVIAREYGLPCVASCRGAMCRLATGDVVCVDGGAGVVRRIEPAANAAATDATTE